MKKSNKKLTPTIGHLNGAGGSVIVKAVDTCAAAANRERMTRSDAIAIVLTEIRRRQKSRVKTIASYSLSLGVVRGRGSDFFEYYYYIDVHVGLPSTYLASWQFFGAGVPSAHGLHPHS